MSINSKMTALADEVRQLSGTTTPKGIDTMISDIDTANIEIANQEDLIAQIASAVDNLPEAGGGGSNFELCAVTISGYGGSVGSVGGAICYTTIENGQLVCKRINGQQSSSITVPCAKGSLLIVNQARLQAGHEMENLTELTVDDSLYFAYDGILVLSVSHTESAASLIINYVNTGG